MHFESKHSLKNIGQIELKMQFVTNDISNRRLKTKWYYMTYSTVCIGAEFLGIKKALDDPNRNFFFVNIHLGSIMV